MPQCVIVPISPVICCEMSCDEELLTQLVVVVEMPQCIRSRTALQTLNNLRVANHHLTKRKEGVHPQAKSFVVPTYYLLFQSAKSGRQNIT